MKNYILCAFCCCFLFASCKKQSQQQLTIDPPSQSQRHETTQDFSSLSIYNLPSKWTNQHGEELPLSALEGHVVVMVMIYTTCKAACPRLVADMRYIAQNITSEQASNVRYVLVSIDPKTDTPEHLLAFSKENKMDTEQWVFLRSTEADTREFAATLAVNYKQISPIDFSHSNIISVFNKKGELVYQQEGLGVDYAPTINEIEQQLSQ